MSRYLVTITTSNEVEADDEEEAVETALDLAPETCDITVEELDGGVETTSGSDPEC